METVERSASPLRVRWPMVIAALALVAGAGMALGGFQAQGLVDTRFDPYQFGEMGRHLARGEGFSPFGVLIKRRAPLYPLVIGGFYAAFGERPLLVLLFQVLLHAGTCLLVLDLGRRLFGERTGVLAALAFALHPMALRYVGDLHLETLLTFLFTLSLWLSVRFHARPTVANGAWLGLALGLAALTKAVAVLYGPVFCAGLVLAGLRRRLRGRAAELPWAAMVTIGLVMALVISPWTVRNYRATGGKLVLISSGLSDAFLRGYVFSRTEFALLRKPPYTDAENESNAWFRRLAREAGTEWERDDWETDQLLNRAAKAKLAEDPAGFVRKFAVGLFTFWYELTSLTNSLVVGAVALVSWLLAALGLRRARREGRPAWLMLLPILYLNLLLAALLALGRYSAPVIPPLLVLAAYGVDDLVSRWEARRA